MSCESVMMKVVSYLFVASALIALGARDRAEAARTRVCFPADRVQKIADLNFNDRVFLSSDHAVVIIEDKRTNLAKSYDLAGLEPRRSGSRANGLISPVALRENSNQIRNSIEVYNVARPMPETSFYPLSSSMRLEIIPESVDASALNLQSVRRLCVGSGGGELTSRISRLAFLRGLSRPHNSLSAAQLQEFIALLNKDAANKHPAQVLAALHGILYESGALYEALTRQFPELGAIKVRPDQSALTKAERLAIRQRVKQHVYHAFDIEGVVPFALVRRLAPLVRTYLRESEKREAMELIAYADTQAAAAIPGYRHIFAYKVWAFAYDAAGELFKSTDATPFTDLSLSRDKNGLDLTLLGSEPLAGIARGRFGFFWKTVRRIPFSALRAGKNRFSFAWMMAGRRYRSVIDLNFTPQGESTPSPSSALRRFPDAPSARGMVAISSNVENSLVASTKREYMRYFHERGFKFSPPVKIADAYRFLAQSIAGKKPVDYLIKEAHSDGHENKLFDLARKGLLIVGRRKRDSAVETIEILYAPRIKHLRDADMTNAQFGDLLRRRERAGLPPLVYLNASCWSVDKAVFELSQADTPELIDIPASNPVNTFVDKPGNAERIILNGIRHGESFAQVRAKLRLGADYASGQADGYMFPDEARYKTSIDSKLSPLVQSGSRIFRRGPGGKWKRYVPDGY